jgi:putative hemolysin
MWLNISLFLIFLFFSAFFSAAETALFSLNEMRLRRLIERVPRAIGVKKLLEKPTHLLATIVFGNMLVNIGISSLTTIICVVLFGKMGVLLSVVISASAILLFGEIFPKTFAIYNAENLAVLCAGPLNIFAKVFYPAINLMEAMSSAISNKFIGSSKREGIGEDDLKGALLLGKQEGTISADEAKMIRHILEFKDTWAGEILTARTDIKGMDIKFTQDETLKFLRETKYSHLPVYENSLDNVVGVISARKIFLNHPKDWRLFLREPLFVPESKRIGELLKNFVETNERVAIVLDEYGGTEGMVTLEDIEEEIFGEIYDEFEVASKPLEKIEERTWRVYGKTAIKTVNLEIGCDIPEDENNIAAFLLAQMGKIPRGCEKFVWNNMEFTIERVTARRIVSVTLKVQP